MAGRRKRIVDTSTPEEPQPLGDTVQEVVEAAVERAEQQADTPKAARVGRHSRTASFGARIYTKNEQGSPYVRHGQDPHRGEQIMLFSEEPPKEIKQAAGDLGFRYQPVEKYWTRSDDAPLPEGFSHPTDYGKYAVETVGNAMRAANGLEPATLSYVKGRGY